MSILGVYKIPIIKHVFFILSSVDSFLDSLALSQHNKKRMEYFEHILRSTDHRLPKEIQQWTLAIVSVDGFLSAIKQCIPIVEVSSNQSSHNPKDLELLAINLVKTDPNLPDNTFNTPKALRVIPDEDIIEVFI